MVLDLLLHIHGVISKGVVSAKRKQKRKKTRPDLVSVAAQEHGWLPLATWRVWIGSLFHSI
jgi:hypothetical protein